jgi:hypothetical protein
MEADGVAIVRFARLLTHETNLFNVVSLISLKKTSSSSEEAMSEERVSFAS